MDTEQTVLQLLALLVYGYRISPEQCELLWQRILQAKDAQTPVEQSAKAAVRKDGGTQ